MSLKKIIYLLSPAFIHPYFKKMEASDVGARLARGILWSLAGSVTSRGLMLCATILVARMLGKVGYGELGMIQTTVGMFGVFAGFGLGITATKHVAEFRNSDPKRAGRIIGISALFASVTGGAIALVLVIFAPWIAEHTINAPQLTGILRFSALILFFNALNGAQTGALAGFEAFKAIAQVNLVVGLISFPMLVGGTYIAGLEGAVCALAINLCFNWLLNNLALRREAKRFRVPFTLKNCGQEWPVLWKFSLPAAIGGALVGPVNWACAALLVNRSDGYGEMGVYSAADQWFTILMYVPALLGSVLLPILSEQRPNNRSNKLLKTLALAIKTNLIIVVPLIVIGGIASPSIMGMYGGEFTSGWPTLIVVLITAGLLAVQAPVGQLIIASGRMWLGAAMNLVWALVFLTSTYALVDHGSIGLASARLISYLVHAISTVAIAYYLTREGS